jgi:hypothetical protein
MGRKIGENLRNVFRFKDAQSGDWINLYYRSPRTEEMISYFSGLDKEKYEEQIVQRRIEYALKIVEGFKDGSFEKENGDGGFIAFSSNPGSPGFDPEWKDLLVKGAGDILSLFAFEIFEAPMFGMEVITEKKS